MLPQERVYIMWDAALQQNAESECVQRETMRYRSMCVCVYRVRSDVGLTNGTRLYL